MKDMDLLNQAMAHDNNAGFGGGEIEHKKEPENLDELALIAIDKKLPPNAAKFLAKEKLINNLEYDPGLAPNEQIQNQHNAQLMYQKNNPKNDELESTIAFLKEKLKCAEEWLKKDTGNYHLYKDEWTQKIIEAAGENLMTAAGKGFLKQKENNEQE